jgi:hypothetical protein
MSVRTTADEYLDNVKDNIREAYSNILKVLDDDTWGSSDFSSEYIETLDEVCLSLLKIKRLLK